MLQKASWKGLTAYFMLLILPEPLAKKNVDTGMGLERTVCVLTGKQSVYEIDAFAGILRKISVIRMTCVFALAREIIRAKG